MTHRASNPLEIVNMDLAGPFEPDTLERARYFLVIVDNYSRYYHVVGLKHKDAALSKFVAFKNEHEKRLEKHIKVVRSDNGGEFINTAFDLFMRNEGIKREPTGPYTPEQNGLAERSVRTVKEGGRALLNDARLERSFWLAASKSFVYARNRTVGTATERTPYEHFFGTKPDVSHLRTFGCVAWVQVPKQRRRGWDNHARKCVMIGYGQDQGVKGYRLYDPAERRVIVSANVKFWEEQRWRTTPEQVSAQTLHPPQALEEIDDISDIEDDYPSGEEGDILVEDEAQEDDDDPAEQDEPQGNGDDPAQQDEPAGEEHNVPIAEDLAGQPAPVPLVPGEGRPVRERRRPQRYDDYVAHHADGSPSKHHRPLKDEIESAMEDVSSTTSADLSQYRTADLKELKSMQENDVWELVPPNKTTGNIVTCKWVRKEKHTGSGETILKSRLVARGFSQKEGVDYHLSEIFSPVTKLETVRVVLAIAASAGRQMHLAQADVTTAFLYGELKESVFMQQPPGYEDPARQNWVCRLKKTLYGLHQAPREWHTKFSSTIEALGFKPLLTDPSAFIYLGVRGLGG